MHIKLEITGRDCREGLFDVYLNVAPFELHRSNHNPNNRDQQTCRKIHDTKNILFIDYI